MKRPDALEADQDNKLFGDGHYNFWINPKSSSG